MVLGYAFSAYTRFQKELRSGEARSRALLNAIPDLMFRFRLDGTFLDFHAHDTARNLVMPPETIIGSNIYESPIPREVIDQIMAASKRALETAQVETVEYALSWPSGIRNYETRIVAGGTNELVSIVRDITESKQAEEAIQKREAAFRAVLETIPCLTVIVRRDHTLLYFNPAAEKITGYAAEEVLGKNFLETFVSDEAVRKRIQGEMENVLASAGVRGLENPLQHKDGSQRWFLWNGQILPDYKGEPALLGIGLDITDRKLAEEALRGSQQEMRALAGRLISVKEEESKRLARELHDAFSQRLAGLGIELAALEQELASPSGSPGKSLQRMKEEVGRLAREVHQLSRQLHPSLLDDLGLTTTLEAECSAFSRQHGVSAKFLPTNVPDSLPSDISLSLYRIAQESLWNVARHAQAQEVWLLLSQAEGDLILAVEDDGKGFDPDQIKGKGGLGLATMEERARLVRGSFLVQSQPGKGTRVEVRVPLPQREE